MHQPIGVKNPIMVRAKEAALLEALRRSPEGMRIPAICEVSGEPQGAVADRLNRLRRRGEVEKIGWLWRLPRDDAEPEDELPEPEPPEPEPEPETGFTSWIRPISLFVRRSTGEFDCRRYG
jgi:hypothetical protein